MEPFYESPHLLELIYSGYHIYVSEEELRKLKEESNVDSLRQELEKERSRNSELEQKINDILRSRWLF